MRKAKHVLFDDSIATGGFRNSNQFDVWRDLWEEVIRIEIPHSLLPRATRARRDKKDIGIFGHGGEGRLCIFEFEFRVEMPLPDRQHCLFFSNRSTHGKFLS